MSDPAGSLPTNSDFPTGADTSLIPFSPLAIGFPSAADGCRALTGSLLGRLLEVPAKLHFAIDALALQLLFQGTKGLVDVIVADDDLHTGAAFS